MIYFLQVATRKVSDVRLRLAKAGFDYAVANGVDMHVNIYLNKVIAIYVYIHTHTYIYILCLDIMFLYKLAR